MNKTMLIGGGDNRRQSYIYDWEEGEWSEASNIKVFKRSWLLNDSKGNLNFPRKNAACGNMPDLTRDPVVVGGKDTLAMEVYDPTASEYSQVN